MQWRFILREYSPELIYIQSSKNITADVLSKLDIADTANLVKNHIKSVNGHNGLEDHNILHPLIMEQLCKINRKTKI